MRTYTFETSEGAIIGGHTLLDVWQEMRGLLPFSESEEILARDEEGRAIRTSWDEDEDYILDRRGRNVLYALCARERTVGTLRSLLVRRK